MLSVGFSCEFNRLICFRGGFYGVAVYSNKIVNKSRCDYFHLRLIRNDIIDSPYRPKKIPW